MKRLTSRLAAACLVMLALLLAGCADKPELTTKTPSLRGEIKELSSVDGRVNGFYAEGPVVEGIEYDRAHISLTGKTRIYRQMEDGYEVVERDALQTGQQVDVLFTGGVRESYPVQATAGEIIILSR